MKDGWIISLIIVLVFVLVQCKKEEKPVPACIQQKIDSIKGRPQSSPPVEVHAWDFEGRRVYLFSAANPGDSVKVFDANCQYVCAPSGGATGMGDTLCRDFYLQAQHKQLVWKDNR